MALGRKQNIENAGNKLILRIKNKGIDSETKKEIPLMPNQFEILEKVGEKWTKREGYDNSIAGDITKVFFDEGEYNGESYKVVKVNISVPEKSENYLLDLRYTSTSRSLFNSLLNLTSGDGINISLYKSVGKEGTKSAGREFSNIALWQDKKLIKGKFGKEDVPAPEEIKDKKGNVVKRDFSEIDSFYEEELKKWAKTLNLSSAKKNTKAAKEESPESQDTSSDDNIPF